MNGDTAYPATLTRTSCHCRMAINAGDHGISGIIADIECRKPRTAEKGIGLAMTSRIRNLVREFRERSVFRATVTYSVVAWMLLQVADVTFDRLPLPESAMTILIVLVIIGFPITLALA